MFSRARWIINGPLMALGNQILLLLILLATLGYEGIGEVGATNFRHRQRDTKGSAPKPYFKPTNQNITVHPGERAVLRCRVEDLGTKTVTWRKQGEINPLTIGYFTFSPDTRLNLDYNKRTNEWSLFIQSVKPEDEGWYHCQVTTKDDPELYYPIKLNVLTVQITGTDYVVVGNQLQLMCNATGKPVPPHNVDWYKDGILLQSDAQRGVIITKKIETKVLVSMLVIKELKLSDRAVYTCRSSNQDAAEFTLNVLDPIEPDVKVPRVKSGEAEAYHKGVEYVSSSSSWSHRNSPLGISVVCFCTLLMLLDTRWRS